MYKKIAVPKSIMEIITSKSGWNSTLERVVDYDVYHTYDYHKISKAPNDKAVLIKYEHQGVLIGLPLLIRRINDSNYYDATSVYGYGGPVCNAIPIDFDLEHFHECMMAFFIENNIVTVFARLHPFLPFQNTLLQNMGELTCLGKVVNIDLSISLEKQYQKYQKRLRTYVNKANRKLELKLAETDEDHQTFMDLYNENMNRVNAKNLYYFDDDYFKNLKSSKDFKTDVLLAVDKESGNTVAGAMFFKTKSTVQYHLSGSATEYLNLNGSKFLIDQMRKRAYFEGYSSFNLGGGLGANEKDSLFKFKSSFSNDFHPFFVWKLITNEKIYNWLCKESNIADTDTTFFPLYRLNEHV